MALWEEDEITIAKLLERTAIDGGAMTQILKKMVGKGLLEIIKDEHDKRKRLLQLTQEGQPIKKTAAHIPNDTQCKFESIDRQQVEQLMSLLDLVVNDFSE